MTITVTSKAATHIQRVLSDSAAIGLRVGVKEVGCSGLTYTFDYATKVKETDTTFKSKNVNIVIENKYLSFLDGSILDFERKGLNEMFKVENPNAAATCGCGESFTVVKPVQ